MNKWRFLQAGVVGLAQLSLVAGVLAAETPFASAPGDYPLEVAQALLKRRLAEQESAKTLPAHAAFAFVANNLAWPAGQRLIVAVYGGRYEVWRDVSAIADEWSKYANVVFDFGLDAKTNTARMWDPSDPKPNFAHIRIRLDIDSPNIRYSAVGREATLPEFSTGSMVLGGIAARHGTWTAIDRGDILHEFGHALGFLHEHQRPECASEFRRTPGPHGEPTIFDIYKSQFNWDRGQVETNLFVSATYKTSFTGKPQKKSLFNYPTPDPVLPALVNGTKGPCYTRVRNTMLSATDIARAREDYPFSTDNSIVKLSTGNLATLTTVANSNFTGVAAAPLLARLENARQAALPIVYIQVADGSQRSHGESLRSALQAKGYVALGVENIAGKALPPGVTEVRYFSDADAVEASSVAQAAKAALGLAEVPVRRIERKSERKQPLEIWFAR